MRDYYFHKILLAGIGMMGIATLGLESYALYKMGHANGLIEGSKKTSEYVSRSIDEEISHINELKLGEDMMSKIPPSPSRDFARIYEAGLMTGVTALEKIKEGLKAIGDCEERGAKLK